MSGEPGKSMLSAPPRLLLGASFLFWGGMHGQAVAGLIAAVLVEGRHWTNLRWDFSDKGFARSWQLSVIVLIVSALVLLQQEDLRATDFLNLLSWLPFMMLPLVLAQQYVKKGGIPMVTFSFIARRKAAADRKAGRPVESGSIQLGYPVLVLVMIAAGMGVGSLKGSKMIDPRYPVGVAILLGWAIFSLGGRKVRPQAWAFAYLTSLLMTVGMALGVVKAYDYFVKSYAGTGGRSTSAQQTQTSLGTVEELQKSHKIEWRYFHEKGLNPNLLKLGSYNEPLGDIWQARTRILEVKEQIPDGRKFSGDFETFLPDGEDAFAFREEDRDRKYRIEGRIQGLIDDDELVPYFESARRFEEIPSEILAVNSMGSVKMIGVNRGAMEARIQADPEVGEMRLDPSDLDLTYPKGEEEGLENFLKEVGLNFPNAGQHPTRALSRKVGGEARPPDLSVEKFREIEAKIALTFTDPEKFEYTLLLAGTDRNEPITEFLGTDRKGHCEYFAGSTAMLLRRMGIPCRYTVGYALREKGSGDGEWILRGQHAHAWVEAYIGGTWLNEKNGDVDVWRCRGGEWVNVDLTPPDWANGPSQHAWYQGLSDWFQGFRANLELWLDKPGVFDQILNVLALIGGLFLVFVIYRLIRTRRRDVPDTWEQSVRKAGLLRDFEKWLSKRVGHRPRSMPMGIWLRRSLPTGCCDLVKQYENMTFRVDEGSEVTLRGAILNAKRLWKEQEKTPGAKDAREVS
ncbi:MAG: transglutaminase-like domain-containing protein [Akkermansiaceae bacterium]